MTLSENLALLADSLKVYDEVEKPGSDDKLRVGLAEDRMVFMQEQSSMVHRLVRLLKFWSKTVFVPGFLGGRSYTLELFAVAAGEDESEDLLRGFQVALQKIRDFRGMSQVWERFYTKSQVASEILSQKPLLLDVSDPSINLFVGRMEFLEVFATFAASTLKRIDGLESGVPEGLARLFELQPPRWNTMANRPKRRSFLLPDTRESSSTLVGPRVETVSKKAQHLENEMEMYAHAISAMNHCEHFFCPRDPPLEFRTVTKLALESLGMCMGDQELRTGNFEKKDVTLVIPLPGTKTYVQIGLDVAKNWYIGSTPPKYYQSEAGMASVAQGGGA